MPLINVRDVNLNEEVYINTDHIVSMRPFEPNNPNSTWTVKLTCIAPNGRNEQVEVSKAHVDHLSTHSLQR